MINKKAIEAWVSEKKLPKNHESYRLDEVNGHYCVFCKHFALGGITEVFNFQDYSLCEECDSFLAEEHTRQRDGEFATGSVKGAALKRITEFLSTGLFDNPEDFVLNGHRSEFCYFCLDDANWLEGITGEGNVFIPIPYGQVDRVCENMRICGGCYDSLVEKTNAIAYETYTEVAEDQCPICEKYYPITFDEENKREVEKTTGQIICDPCNKRLLGSNKENVEITCNDCLGTLSANICNVYFQGFLLNQNETKASYDVDMLCMEYTINCMENNKKKVREIPIDLLGTIRIKEKNFYVIIDKLACTESKQEVYFLLIDWIDKTVIEGTPNKLERKTIYESKKKCSESCGCYNSLDYACIKAGQFISHYQKLLDEETEKNIT